MLNQDIFYFASIRNISAAFGGIFSNIRICRYANNAGTGAILKTIKVPFAYAGTQKWLSQNAEEIRPAPALIDQTKVKTRVRTSLPRMSYEITSLLPDMGRKLQTLNSVHRQSEDVTKFLKQLVPVPYDIGYEVNIKVKEVDDGFQILEQILPNFVPSFNMTVKDIPELGITRDIPVQFGGITKSDTYEGSYEEERVIEWTLSFVAKGYVYPIINNAGIIKEAIIRFSQSPDMTNKLATIETEVNPLSANKSDVWTADTDTFEAPAGIDSNGAPIGEDDSNS